MQERRDWRRILRKRYCSSSEDKGFTLIELGVVITIIAFIISSSLSAGATLIERNRITTTNDRLDIIEEAIKVYVQSNGYLPCPSDPQLSYVAAGFGIGAGTGKGDEVTTDCTDANLVYAGAGADIAIGTIPTVTLGLVPAIALDGWNHKFTYAVDKNLVNQPAYDVPGAEGDIVLMGEGGTAVFSDKVAYILISHGNDGDGAYTARVNTGRLPDGADASQLENYDDDEIFENEFKGTFTDMVRYKEKWQLIEGIESGE